MAGVYYYLHCVRGALGVVVVCHKHPSNRKWLCDGNSSDGQESKNEVHFLFRVQFAKLQADLLDEIIQLEFNEYDT